MSQPPYGYGYAGQAPYNTAYGGQQQQPPPGWNPQMGAGGPAQPGYAPVPPVMHVAPPAGSYNANYTEQAVKRDFGFDDKSIRAGFIRKVFSMVALMLLVVTAMVAVPILSPETKQFVRGTSGGFILYMASYVTFLVVYIALMCCESVRRSYPINLIMTAILTLAIGFMTMMITAYHDLTVVLMALGITTVVCAAIIIFAMQTKYDLTSCMGFMFIAGMVLFFYGLFAIIFTSITHSMPWLYTIYAGLAALLFMVYLAIDIQMLMGGRKYELSPEDYIFAAIQIFIDIVYIFWMILHLLGAANN